MGNGGARVRPRCCLGSNGVTQMSTGEEIVDVGKINHIGVE